MRRVLGDIGRGPAILAAQRQALQQPQRDQDHRREQADAVGGRQQADDEGRQAHDHDGDQEGVLAPDQVAEAAEDQGAERPDQEAGGERQQREDVAGGLVELGEELTDIKPSRRASLNMPRKVFKARFAVVCDFPSRSWKSRNAFTSSAVTASMLDLLRCSLTCAKNSFTMPSYRTKVPGLAVTFLESSQSPA